MNRPIAYILDVVSYILEAHHYNFSYASSSSPCQVPQHCRVGRGTRLRCTLPL